MLGYCARLFVPPKCVVRTAILAYESYLTLVFLLLRSVNDDNVQESI